jgi:hypothetical protein
MPTFPANPNTKAIGNAVVGFLQALTSSSGAPIYVANGVQLEEFKDLTALVAAGVCAEVYGNVDTSERRGFGGRIWDTQRWFILSICSLDTPLLAAQIYDVRDALVQPFQQHAQLNNVVSNVFHSQLQNNMRFIRILRNGVYYRAHLAELETRSEWTVPIPPGVIS